MKPPPRRSAGRWRGSSVRVLVTGGSGRLGRELQTELPRLGVEAFFPDRTELDITLPATVVAALERYQPSVLIHAAAYTDVKGAEVQKELCWGVNVGGT